MNIGMTSQVAQVVKKLPASAGDEGDMGSVFGSGRFPGGGNATHSCIISWKIPGTEEPGEGDGYSHWSWKDSDMMEHTHGCTHARMCARTHTHTHTATRLRR